MDIELVIKETIDFESERLFLIDSNELKLFESKKADRYALDIFYGSTAGIDYIKNTNGKFTNLIDFLCESAIEDYDLNPMEPPSLVFYLSVDPKTLFYLKRRNFKNQFASYLKKIKDGRHMELAAYSEENLPLLRQIGLKIEKKDAYITRAPKELDSISRSSIQQITEFPALINHLLFT